MQIVIDIPEKVVRAIQGGRDYRYDIHTAIAQGTPLPKIHGRLIDAEILWNVYHAYIKYDFYEALNDTPTAIEAYTESEGAKI